MNMDLNDENGLDEKNSRKRKIVLAKDKQELYDGDAINPIEGTSKSDNMPNLSDNESDTCENYDYGLNHQYLKSLGIKPPLDKWVYVTNIRCDKSELRDVLELAGEVVICALITVHSKCAKVMYSHPLEAVQAVSMLNGQTFYGQKLQVTMINCPFDTVILPKGLTDVGPGLGTKGKPLREIVKHYEKFLRNQESDININLFHKSDNSQYDDDCQTRESCLRDNLSDDEQSSQDSTNKNISITKEFKVTSVENLAENFCDNSNKKAKLYSTTSPISNMCSPNPISENENVSGFETKFRTMKKDNLSQEDTILSHNIRPSGSQIENKIALYHPNSSPKCVQSSVSSQYQSPGLQQPSTLRLAAPRPHVNFGPPVIGPNVPHPTNSGFSSMSTSTVTNINMGPSGPSSGIFRSPMGPQMMTSPNLGPIRGAMVLPVPRPPIGSPELFTLLFRNLPPSTTFPLLCEKLSQCGQVVSLQLTTPGCAVAQFTQKAHADRCFQIFNGKCIDGHIIEARIG